jgi:hypothetical protein
VRAKAASILPRKGDEDVRAAVDPNDRLRGGAIRQELHVFNLFGSVAGDGGCVREDGVTVYGIW